MRTAFSYIRFSSIEQRKGDSLDRQLERSLAWCQRNNCTLDDSLRFRDLGVSAFKSKNMEEGRLGAFLQEVREGRVPRGSVLIVENLDRLSRDHVRAALNLFLSILEAGITIVTTSPEQVFDPDRKDG